MTALEARHNVVQAMVWLLLLGLAAISGLLIATNQGLFVLAAAAIGWMITLPYHAQLSMWLSGIMFGAGILVPFFPGRPQLWELGTVLGWTGMIVTLSLRRQAPGYDAALKRYRWMLFGGAGFVAVLLVLMKLRGVGFQIFGGSQGATKTGGRFYLQQVFSGILPFVFLAVAPSEKTLVRICTIQFALGATYLISDFAFAAGPAFYPLLYFFDLSTDAFGFEAQAQTGGIRRFQSFARIALNGSYLLMVAVPIRRMISFRGLGWMVLFGMLITMGLLGGHRGLLALMGVTTLLMSWTERIWNPLRVVMAGLLVGAALLLTYTFARELPLAAQRTLSALPGIKLDSVAADDGRSTLVGRTVMRNVAFELVPYYWLVGRGLQFAPDLPREVIAYDPSVRENIEIGRFYNGLIGLAVNTGLPGAFCFAVMLAAGTSVALDILRRFRRFGMQDRFERMCALMACLWITSTLYFCLLDGSSDFALTSFALPGSLLIAFHQRLLARPLPEIPESTPRRR